jgi:molybdate transport system ATP-binding protein
MSGIEAKLRGRQGAFELDVAFEAPVRGVTALFGPSGCGKTTVLRCVAGLERLAAGRLVVAGRIWQDADTFLPPHRRAVGYVFQEANLFPHLSVRGNLDYGRKRAGHGGGNGQGGLAFDEVADLLGLARLMERAPLRLSGGERQRVAIGRALLSSPQVLLMDEPLSALDKFARDDILPYLERLHAELAIPVLFVSHDLTEVERLADRLVLMEAGKVRAAGAVADLLADPELPLARLPEAASLVTGRVAGYDERYGIATLVVSGVEFQVPGDIGAVGASRRLRIQASDVALCRPPAPVGSSILNAPVAVIRDAAPHGEHRMTVFLRLGPAGGGAALIARITRKSWETLGLQPGDVVHALVKSVALAD